MSEAAARPTPPPAGAPRTDRLHVVLATEGTYPHFRGGVSTWCEHLIRGNPDVDFTVWALMMNPFIAPQFPFPGNVRRFIGLPLWGTEQPVEFTPQVGASKALALAPRTTEQRVHDTFAPMLRRLLVEMASPTFDPGRFGDLLLEIHRYFGHHDYRSTFRSRTVWETFKTTLAETSSGPLGEVASEGEEGFAPEMPATWEEASSLRELFRRRPAQPPPRETGLRRDPAIADAIEGMRWMYRLLLPLNMPVVEADVIHTSAAAFCGIPGILAKIDRGTPLLVTEHGVYMREQYLAVARLGFSYHLKKFVVQMIAAVSRACLHYADQISPVCEFNARWERRNGADPERIDVIYNGVDPVVYSPQRVDRPVAPTVVTLARIDPLKDLETLMRVAEIVRREIPEVHFLHFGPVADEKYARRVRRLVRELDLERTVTFMGATAEAARAWNQGDVALLTSMSEAFPYAVIEALMCGLPVVSTDVGGVREALDGVGSLARAGDAGGLAEDVLRYLRLDPAARAQLSEECRTRALNHFTLESAIRRYRDSYRSLAELGRGRGGPGPVEGRAEEALEREKPTPVAAPEVDLARQEHRDAETTVGTEPGQPASLAAARREAEAVVPSLTGNRDARLAALQSSYARRDETLAEAVRVLRNDPDPEIRRQTVVAILAAPLSASEGASMLAEALGSDPDPAVRSAAASALIALVEEAPR